MNKPTVSVDILGHEFKISFATGHESDLKEAADYLNKQMQDIKATNKVTNLEKLTIIAALNITHTLLSEIKSNSKQEQKIKQLTEQLDNALNKESNLL